MKCQCDFCTGAKKREDNWCARCGDVQMQPPKWWENLDVCDACDTDLAAAWFSVADWRPFEQCLENVERSKRDVVE